MAIFNFVLRFALLWTICGLITLFVYCIVRESLACMKYVKQHGNKDTHAMVDEYFDLRDEALGGSLVFSAMSSASKELRKNQPLRYMLSFVMGLCVWPSKIFVCRDLYDYIEGEVLNKS